jgi:hypothetical protein
LRSPSDELLGALPLSDESRAFSGDGPVVAETARPTVSFREQLPLRSTWGGRRQLHRARARLRALPRLQQVGRVEDIGPRAQHTTGGSAGSEGVGQPLDPIRRPQLLVGQPEQQSFLPCLGKALGRRTDTGTDRAALEQLTGLGLRVGSDLSVGRAPI